MPTLGSGDMANPIKMHWLQVEGSFSKEKSGYRSQRKGQCILRMPKYWILLQSTSQLKIFPSNNLPIDPAAECPTKQNVTALCAMHIL